MSNVRCHPKSMNRPNKNTISPNRHNFKIHTSNKPKNFHSESGSSPKIQKYVYMYLFTCWFQMHMIQYSSVKQCPIVPSLIFPHSQLQQFEHCSRLWNEHWFERCSRPGVLASPTRDGCTFSNEIEVHLPGSKL